MSKVIPFTQTTGNIWINGEMIPVKDAKIPLLSHGLHYGSTVFEGERAYGGVIFKSGQHTSRLMNSCQLLGFELPFDFDSFEQSKMDVLQDSGLKDAYIRAIAWRGSGALGVGSSNNKINAAIAIWQMSPYFNSADGIRLTISSWRRPPAQCAPVKAKAAGLYAICTLSKDTSLSAGYDDALMLDIKGRIAECTGAHIFFVQDNQLFTPKADWMIDGITRASVMEIADKLQVPVTETSILPEQIPDFSEAFICGSAVEIVPVREIARTEFTPGDLTQKIINAYDKMKYGLPF